MSPSSSTQFFSNLHETLYTSHIKLFAGALVFFTHTHSVSTHCRSQNSIFKLQSLGSQKDGRWTVLNQDCRKMRGNSPSYCCNCLPCAQNGVWSGTVMQKEDPIHLLFAQTLQIHCCNFLNVCTFCCELNVIPICKNYTNKIPSLSQMSLAWLVGCCRACHQYPIQCS
jgi:hypothetical protein